MKASSFFDYSKKYMVPNGVNPKLNGTDLAGILGISIACIVYKKGETRKIIVSDWNMYINPQYRAKKAISCSI